MKNKTFNLSIMLYKVYVNLCDFKMGSYVSLGTTAAQSYIYMTLGCSMQTYYCIWSTGLKEDFLKISPFWPLAGGRAICDPIEFI